MLALPALAYLLVPRRQRRRDVHQRGRRATRALLAARRRLHRGAADAVRRGGDPDPAGHLGLIQYLAPMLQFVIGVLVYCEPMPPSRLAGFALVWVALAVFACGRAPTRAARRPRRGRHRAATVGRGRRGPRRRLTRRDHEAAATGRRLRAGSASPATAPASESAAATVIAGANPSMNAAGDA